MATFGSGGVAQFDVDGAQDVAVQGALQANGAILIVGKTIGGQFAATRLTASGTLDGTFGTGGIFHVLVGDGATGGGRSVVVQSDGMIDVGGTAVVGALSEMAVIRLTSAGALDPTFGSAGVSLLPFGASNAYGQVMAYANDGALVVAGYRTGAKDDFALARLTGPPVANYAGSSADWSAGSNMFGACLRAVSGSGVAGTWTVNATCPATTGTHWNAIPTTSASAGSKIAASPTSGVNGATASLRFGFRTASNQPPGAYTAPMTFEVVAPNV